MLSNIRAAVTSHGMKRSALVACLSIAGVQGAHAAVLVDQGITYDFTSSGSTYTLAISGINAATDLEGGRHGVQSFAFTDPVSNVTPAVTTLPTGFTLLPGGLNASGCNSAGNFFCFQAVTTPTGPALAANSTLSFSFTLATAAVNWTPDFKINWVGTKNNYDLVSRALAPTPVGGGGGTPVPAPTTLALLGIATLGLGWARRKRG